MQTTTNWQSVLSEITSDPRYKRNILYGRPGSGHSEGTVAAHIHDLELNLDLLTSKVSITEDQYIKLKVLIHVHDSFKAEAKRNSPILDPNSHASLARAYLHLYTEDKDMLEIIQYHDLGYTLYRKLESKGWLDEMRLMSSLQYIKDLDLYLLFCIIDACTPSKGREMIVWFVNLVNSKYPNTTVTEKYILPGEMRVGSSW